MNKIVDKSSSDPLYKQLASEFLNRIDEGLWRAGDKLPSEKELMDEFERRIGRGYLGNCVASGTEIIEELGDERLDGGFGSTGK